MSMKRRDFLKGLLTALVVSQVPIGVETVDPQSGSPAVVGYNPIIRIPQELVDDAVFDLEAFLQEEVTRSAGVKFGKPRRLTELYAAEGQVGFLFRGKAT